MKNDFNMPITAPNLMELAKNGWDKVIELYKNSSTEERNKILKILGSLGGFGLLLKFLKNL